MKCKGDIPSSNLRYTLIIYGALAFKTSLVQINALIEPKIYRNKIHKFIYYPSLGLYNLTYKHLNSSIENNLKSINITNSMFLRTKLLIHSNINLKLRSFD